MRKKYIAYIVNSSREYEYAIRLIEEIYPNIDETLPDGGFSYMKWYIDTHQKKKGPPLLILIPNIEVGWSSSSTSRYTLCDFPHSKECIISDVVAWELTKNV